jgi:hypothetical protein
MIRLALIALGLTTVAFPQAMMEHALAASGGSASGMAGKPVSEGAIAIFSKAAALLDSAAADRTLKQEPRAAAYSKAPPAVQLPEVVPELFRQVKLGLIREELLASVGTPSSKIIIPEGAQMFEIYRYRANGGTLGAVRLLDGKVIQVIK